MAERDSLDDLKWQRDAGKERAEALPPVPAQGHLLDRDRAEANRRPPELLLRWKGILRLISGGATNSPFTGPFCLFSVTASALLAGPKCGSILAQDGGRCGILFGKSCRFLFPDRCRRDACGTADEGVGVRGQGGGGVGKGLGFGVDRISRYGIVIPYFPDAMNGTSFPEL